MYNQNCMIFSILLSMVLWCCNIVQAKAEDCLTGMFIEEKIHATLAAGEEGSKKLLSQHLSPTEYAHLSFVQQASLIAHIIKEHPEIVFYQKKSRYYWLAVGTVCFGAAVCSFELGKEMADALFKARRMDDEGPRFGAREWGFGFAHHRADDFAPRADDNDDPMAQAARYGHYGVNVHAGDRDPRTDRALRLLVQAQGPLGGDVIRREYDEFHRHVQAFAHVRVRGDALRVMEHWRVVYPDSRPLLGAVGGYLGGLNVTQLLARCWLFAKGHAEQQFLRRAMVEAVARCLDVGLYKCPQGGGQELAVTLLQGRLRGVDIDRVERHAQVSGRIAMRDFFNRPAHQALASRAAVLQAAQKYLEENPFVKKEEFLQEINEYIKQQELE